MVANVARAWLVFAGLVAVVHGCSGESRSNDGAGDAGATATAGSSGASEADAGEAGTGGAGGAAGSGAATAGGAAGTGTGGMGGDVSGTGGAGASAGGSAGNAGGSAGNAGGSAGNAGTGGSGGIPADECDSDEDCPPNECLVPPCPELVCALGSQGYRVCQTRDPLPVGTCSEPTGEPCCESSEDCQDAPAGHCVPFSLGYCGGPAPPDTSTCRYDTCDSDSDCTAGEHGVCLLDYPRTCTYGPCNESADCTEGAGGRCVMTRAGQPCPELVVYCQYDDDPCDSDDDCPPLNGMRQVCEPDADGHGRRCAPWQPPPP